MSDSKKLNVEAPLPRLDSCLKSVQPKASSPELQPDPRFESGRRRRGAENSAFFGIVPLTL